MTDFQKIAAFFRETAYEDWSVAVHLIQIGRVRHGLFMAHLALEKLLKSLLALKTMSVPPRIHNLVTLANAAQLALSPEHLQLLAEFNAYQIEGRYPDRLVPAPTLEEAERSMKRAEEVFTWLLNQL